MHAAGIGWGLIAILNFVLLLSIGVLVIIVLLLLIKLLRKKLNE